MKTNDAIRKSAPRPGGGHLSDQEPAPSAGAFFRAAELEATMPLHIYGFSFDSVTGRWVLCRMERIDGRMRPVADIESFGKSQRRACERRCYELNCEVARSLGHPEPAPFQAGR